MFTAIMKTENGRVSKAQGGFADEAAAQDHVAKHAVTHPEAFVLLTPDAPVGWWLFDVNNDVSVSEPPASTNPRDYTLTPTAWRHMVRKAGLWDHIDTVKTFLKANDLSAWADLMETLEGNQFDFEATLDQITLFAPMLAGMPLPDEAALTPLWLDAAARTEQ